MESNKINLDEINKELKQIGLEPITEEMLKESVNKEPKQSKLKYALAGAVAVGAIGLYGLFGNCNLMSNFPQKPEQNTVQIEQPQKSISEWILAQEWNGLMWETVVPQKPKYSGFEELFTYNKSDARLKKYDMFRHPYPWESGELLCAGLEGKLKAPIKEVYWNMYCEWQNCGMKLDNNEIVLSLDPIFDWDESKGYLLKSYNKLLRIPAKNAKLGYNRIIDLGDEVSKVFYGRTLKELPPEIQNRGELWLGGIDWPVARIDGGFSIDSSHSYLAASRGVRLKDSEP